MVCKQYERVQTINGAAHRTRPPENAYAKKFHFHGPVGPFLSFSLPIFSTCLHVYLYIHLCLYCI